MGEAELAVYELKENIGYITLNRPEKRNALNLSHWNAIGEKIDQAAKDKEARVVILRGAGKSFCAGLELSPDNEILSMIMDKPGAAQKLRFYDEVKHLQDIHNRLESMPQPVIAVIHGHCLGAGLELVLCCDFRLCSADAVFALPEARLAIITDVGGLQRLPRVVGEGHAREISYRAHTFGAEKAKSINLVNEVYPDKDSLDEQALAIAKEIASAPPLAVQGAKDVFLYNRQASLQESLDYNAARSAMIMPSEALMEAVAAFMEKRSGVFKGA